MKKLGIIMLILVTFTSCKSETKGNKANSKTKSTVTTSMSEKNPDVKIKVHKTYDKNGNLVGYDSTYFYSYTSGNGHNKVYNADSLIQQFKKSVPEKLSDQFGIHGFNNLFSDNNPKFYRNFLNDKYFSKSFENEQKHFNKLINSMDSLKNAFFNSLTSEANPNQSQHKHSQSKK